MLLSELDESLSLQVARDGAFRSLGLVDQKGEGLLVALYQSRFLDRLQGPAVGCVITLERLAAQVPSRLGLVIHPDPKRALYDIHDYLFRHTSFYGVSVPSRLAETARVDPRAYVAPLDVSIGAEVVIEPHATILGRAELGSGVVIRAGAVIGAEGFGVRRSGEHLVPVPHAGGVRIGDRAHILSNCTIVRGIFGGVTTIGEETFINAQSYVAHHVSIGKRCRIAAGAVIAGSVQLGDDVWIGPNAVISNGVRIGAGAFVSLGSVVVRDVGPGERVSGHFATAHRDFLVSQVRARRDAGI